MRMVAFSINIMPFKNIEEKRKYMKIYQKKRYMNNKKYYDDFRGKDNGLYKKYLSMRGRCLIPLNKDYKHYGSRGIKLIWNSYEDFKTDMYEDYLIHLKKYKIINTTLDRINVNGNYCKENCRWATIKEQALNRRNSVYYKREYSVDASIRLGGNKGLVGKRIRSGWTIKRAFNFPLEKHVKATIGK